MHGLGNLRFLEKNQIVQAIDPVDLNSGANAGDWVSLKNYHRCAVVVEANNGTAANDITLTLLQATDVSGSDSKALNFTRIDVKQATDIGAVAQFTEVTQAAANTYTSATNGESELIYVIDFLDTDLDVDGGFDCIQLSINQAGAAKVGSALYILHDPKYGTDPGLGAIAD
jgi:hypothetical protein